MLKQKSIFSFNKMSNAYEFFEYFNFLYYFI